MGLQGGILATPVAEGDYLCFASGRGAVLCLDPHSGSVRWQAQSGGQVVSAPLIAAGQLLITSVDGSLNAFELTTGNPQWRFQTGGAIRTAAVIHEELLIVASWDGHLYGLTFEGNLAWKVDLSPARPTSLSAGDGHIVFFDDFTEEIRSIPLAHSAGAGLNEKSWRLPAGHHPGIRPVLVSGLVCWVSHGDDRIVCVDAATGMRRWATKVGSSPLTPVTESDQFIVACRDGQLSALDFKTGAERWQEQTGFLFTSEPALSNGVLHIGGSDKMLYTFDIELEGK